MCDLAFMIIYQTAAASCLILVFCDDYVSLFMTEVKLDKMLRHCPVFGHCSNVCKNILQPSILWAIPIPLCMICHMITGNLAPLPTSLQSSKGRLVSCLCSNMMSEATSDDKGHFTVWKEHGRRVQHIQGL